MQLKRLDCETSDHLLLSDLTQIVSDHWLYCFCLVYPAMLLHDVS